MIDTVLGAAYQDGFDPSSFLWVGAMTSAYDEMSHTFTCENTQCGHRFQKLLRGLLKADKVVCPECGVAIDIHEAKRTGKVGLDFNTASEIDKQSAQKK